MERLFLAETKMTVGEWRRRPACCTASGFATGEPVTNVALDAGYASTSAFIRIQGFRRHPGPIFLTGRVSAQRASFNSQHVPAATSTEHTGASPTRHTGPVQPADQRPEKDGAPIWPPPRPH
jgi:AraC-like DNA-binding protein